MKKRLEKSLDTENQDKKVLLAVIFAAFGFLLFIALALTLPWE